jgi:hypothetical protein
LADSLASERGDRNDRDAGSFRIRPQPRGEGVTVDSVELQVEYDRHGRDGAGKLQGGTEIPGSDCANAGNLIFEEHTQNIPNGGVTFDNQNELVCQVVTSGGKVRLQMSAGLRKMVDEVTASDGRPGRLAYGSNLAVNDR